MQVSPLDAQCGCPVRLKEDLEGGGALQRTRCNFVLFFCLSMARRHRPTTTKKNLSLSLKRSRCGRPSSRACWLRRGARKDRLRVAERERGAREAGEWRAFFLFFSAFEFSSRSTRIAVQCLLFFFFFSTSTSRRSFSLSRFSFFVSRTTSCLTHTHKKNAPPSFFPSHLQKEIPVQNQSHLTDR